MNRSRILVVIVLYNRYLFNTETYSSLFGTKDPDFDLFVYDNGNKCYDYDSNMTEKRKIHYVADKNNPGLSYAYNRAAEYARQNGYLWIMIADQDTMFPLNYLHHVEKAITANPLVRMFAPVVCSNGRIISPLKSYHHVPVTSKPLLPGLNLISKTAVINSGMVICVDAFFRAGGYNESVKLDYSDFQFIDRFKHFYDEFYLLPDECNQNFSDDVQSSESKFLRFEIFCACLRNCETDSVIDKLDYFIIVLKRTISLSFQYLSIKPFIIFFHKFCAPGIKS